MRKKGQSSAVEFHLPRRIKKKRKKEGRKVKN